MKVRQNPVADLDLDDAVEFLSREDVDEIRTFDLSLKCVRQEDKLRRCEEVRDKLVKNHTHIEELSAAYTAVFKTHLKSNAISGPNWDSFQTIALYGQQRLIATIAVSKSRNRVSKMGRCSRAAQQVHLRQDSNQEREKARPGASHPAI
jgi:hypothetical protein